MRSRDKRFAGEGPVGPAENSFDFLIQTPFKTTPTKTEKALKDAPRTHEYSRGSLLNVRALQTPAKAFPMKCKTNYLYARSGVNRFVL